MNFVTNYRLAGITEHPILKDLNVGGAVRWEDQASIGFYGAAPDADGIVRSLDPAKPVWDQARAYFDLQSGYDLKLFAGKVRTRVQLNVRNVFESGRLQRVSVNPDGGAWAYRIICVSHYRPSPVHFDRDILTLSSRRLSARGPPLPR